MNPSRICPGRHLALWTLYLVVACLLLSMFDIGPVSNENGDPQIPKIEFDNTTVRYVFFLEPSQIHTRSPKAFECAIKSRSEDAIKLVQEICDRTNCKVSSAKPSNRCGEPISTDILHPLSPVTS